MREILNWPEPTGDDDCMLSIPVHTGTASRGEGWGEETEGRRRTYVAGVKDAIVVSLEFMIKREEKQGVE